MIPRGPGCDHQRRGRAQGVQENGVGPSECRGPVRSWKASGWQDRSGFPQAPRERSPLILWGFSFRSTFCVFVYCCVLLLLRFPPCSLARPPLSTAPAATRSPHRFMTTLFLSGSSLLCCFKLVGCGPERPRLRPPEERKGAESARE